MMLCDFHIHSTFSDGSLTIPQIVDLYGSRGFGAIAITDHLCEEKTFLGKSAQWLERTLTRETFAHYQAVLAEQAERAWAMYRMCLIPGFELTKNSLLHHRSAHVVVLGAQQFISADQDIRALLKSIRDCGALSIAAHPVSTGRFEPQTYFLWSQREELRNEFDAWEVASGQSIFEPVKESGLPMIANSDMHHLKGFNSWKTVLNCTREPEAIFDAIRDQRIDFTYFADPKPASLKFTCTPFEKVSV